MTRNRATRSTLAWLPLVALLAGCPDREPEAFFIKSTLVPSDGCAFAPGGASYGRGVVDLVLNRTGYILGLSLQNGLPTTEAITGLSEANGQLDGNAIQVTGATISYRASGLSPDSLPSDLFVYRTIVVLAASEQGLAVDIFPPQVLDALRADPYFTGTAPIQDDVLKSCLSGIDNKAPVLEGVPLAGRTIEILVDIQLEGLTVGGNQVLSNVFTFTVRLCNACLVAPGVDATSYLLAREAGDIFCASDAASRCNRGQDVCDEQINCVQQYNDVDQAIEPKLEACAGDATFPSAKLAGRYHPLCKDLKPQADADFFSRLEHLRCLYGLEKASIFCDSGRSLSYPPQPDSSQPTP
jgi:hypothetical protein